MQKCKYWKQTQMVIFISLSGGSVKFMQAVAYTVYKSAISNQKVPSQPSILFQSIHTHFSKVNDFVRLVIVTRFAPNGKWLLALALAIHSD